MAQEYFTQILADLEAISQVDRATRDIDGWLSVMEGAALYSAAAHGPSDGTIVEIGSFKGKSTIWLASGSMKTDREPVYAIDTHAGSSEHQVGGELASHMPPEGTTEFAFRGNIKRARLEDRVVPLVMASSIALSFWQDPIRLLFIDAAHEYEDVRSDFLGWQKHIVLGGLVAFHDVDRWDEAVTLDGPSRVVYEDVAQTECYSEPTIVNHLAVVSRVL